MITHTRKYGLLLVALVIVGITGLACSSSEEPTPTVTPELSIPISFPYIFGGTFTVAGQPGPKDTPMFARLGNGRGPVNNAIRTGEFINVSITPPSPDDVGEEITFYIGDPDGRSVQAEETYVFLATSQPLIIQVDLTFPELP